VQAIGKYVGAHAPNTDLSHAQLRMGGIEIFAHGVFQLDPEKEKRWSHTCEEPSSMQVPLPKTACSRQPLIFRRTSVVWKSTSILGAESTPPRFSAAILRTST